MLLAAKVLVISRLLHKKLSQQPKPPPYLESLRNRLTTLRRRLLARIDLRFKSLDIPSEELVEAMCAFSLATSSSPTDVLRHFHHMRQQAMSEQSHEADLGRAGTLCALQLYIKTLKDSQALVPGQLARALERLKSIPLFKSSDLYSLLELNLDIYERWIGDDIKTFTPYIRQDDLQKSEAETLLRMWAEKAFEGFLNDLKGCIQGVEDLSVIVHLRRQIVELWFSNSWRSFGINPNEALDSFRGVFNSQLIRLVQSRVSSLNDATLAIQLPLSNWESDAVSRCPPLWTSSLVSMEVSGGAKSFQDTLLTTINGRNASLQMITSQYEGWLAGILAIEATIKTLQSEIWNFDFEDIDDDDVHHPSEQTLLSSDDSHVLQQVLSNSLISEFRSLEKSLELSLSITDEHHRGRVSAYLLRIFRELREHLPSSYVNADFGLQSIPKLHQILADSALAIPWQKYQRRSQTRELAGRKLWEGDPELPILPSQWAFRFLEDLLSSMKEFGTDVWSSSAVEVLKKSLRERIESEITRPLQPLSETNGISVTQTNGGTGEAPATNGMSPSRSPISISTSQDFTIQHLFDTLYLVRAAAPGNSHESNVNQDNFLGKRLAEMGETFGMNKNCVERMEKAIGEYWKRTAMLFGLMN